ncbi:hypothetical protein AB0903_28735 [Streptomyces sp. NPDC048389]|uniref:hypothetical protein n=1 Tax=Streptomyces sp. NPDC048389 TaxID=3154622 RepID=UPI003451F909
MTKDVPPTPGSLAAHFHTSVDGTRVFNAAEWNDEHARTDTAAAPQRIRSRITGDAPGVRRGGRRCRHPHTALATGDGDDAR